jgi:hypothetical protein
VAEITDNKPLTLCSEKLILTCRSRRIIAWIGAPAVLCVRFPKAKPDTLRTAAELVEHHRGRARVHRVVPVKSAYGIERTIYVVDTIINPHLIAILDPIFCHGLICPRKIE